jgi:tetratricopeptide (TPR) repeat protein
VSRILLDELEGVDFYIAQGYVDIARDTLDRLRDEHGDHHEILVRYKRLGLPAEPQATSAEPPLQPGPDSLNDEFASLYIEPSSDDESIFMGEVPRVSPAAGIGATTGELMPMMDQPGLASFADTADDDLMFPVAQAEADQHETDEPFLVNKKSGPLNQDLMLHLNTSDLSRHYAGDEVLQAEPSAIVPDSVHIPGPERIPIKSEPSGPIKADSPAPARTEKSGPLGSGRLAPSLPKPSVTADLIASLVSGLDATLGELGIEEPIDAFSSPRPVEQQSPEPAVIHESLGSQEQTLPDPLALDAHPGHRPPTSLEHEFSELARAATQEIAQPLSPRQGGSKRDDDLDVELREMLEELKGNTSELKPAIDFETHYSLGLAYKDMDLLDEAIEQFQSAYRLANDSHEGNYIQCCHMLGFCFNKKRMPKLAIMWFERGLKVPNRPEDEYQALRFEIGLCYEEMGDLDQAIEVFAEVYGIDVNYRQVGAKLRELQAAKNA